MELESAFTISLYCSTVYPLINVLMGSMLSFYLYTNPQWGHIIHTRSFKRLKDEKQNLYFSPAGEKKTRLGHPVTLNIKQAAVAQVHTCLIQQNASCCPGLPASVWSVSVSVRRRHTSARVSQPDNHSIKHRPLGWRSKSARGSAVTMVTEKVCGPPTSQRIAASPQNPASTPPPSGKKQVCCFVFFVFLLLIGLYTPPPPPQPPTAATATTDSPRRAVRSALCHAEECKPLTIKDNSGGLWVIMCHRCVIRLAGFCNQPPHFPKQKVNSHASTLSLARHSGGRVQ